MASLVSALVYDNATGDLHMIVMPDFASQLDDPAFNRDIHTQVRVPTVDVVSARVLGGNGHQAIADIYRPPHLRAIFHRSGG